MKSLKHLRPHSVPCHDYIGYDGNTKIVSAIIVPIGFGRRNGKIVISWACSKGISCHNDECRYSRRGKWDQDCARDKKRTSTKEYLSSFS